MSRAVLMIALHESLGRLPTPEERQRYLESLRRNAAGERIYIAHRQLDGPELLDEIARLKAAKWSVRRIASAVGRSKSHVANIVQNSALSVDSKA